jgi:hypothetical protein
LFLTGDVASAYSFSAEFGIAPIRGNTLSSLLFVNVLPKQSFSVYRVLLMNICTVYSVQKCFRIVVQRC